MTTSSDNNQRGYFNALTAGYFKTGADGRKLFFPWGVLGRGYVIPSEQRYESMRRQLKAYMIALMVLIITPMALKYYLAGFAIAAALMLFYVAWAPFLKRGLQVSEERMTVRENMATQSRIHNPKMLWAMEIAALALVAGGVLMLIFEPRQWLIALGSIVFFGYCAFVIGRMILLRRREAISDR